MGVCLIYAQFLSSVPKRLNCFAGVVFKISIQQFVFGICPMPTAKGLAPKDLKDLFFGVFSRRCLLELIMFF